MTTGEAMEPTRDPRATLPDLVGVLLNRGVYLNLDLIISVSDILLIGLNLRAVLAGMETMLQFGMMQGWDADTRRWVERSVRRGVPVRDDEEILAKMAGGRFHEDYYRTWRPGYVYVTDQRLLVHRRDPAEVLFEAPLDDIEWVRPLPEPTIGGESRIRVLVHRRDGSTTKLSALDAPRLIGLLRARLAEPGGPTDPEEIAVEEGTAALEGQREGHMWCREEMAGGDVWRGGRASMSEDLLLWRSPHDSRALLRAGREDVDAIRLVRMSSPAATDHVLELSLGERTVLLATEDIEAWDEALAEWHRDEGAISRGEHHEGGRIHADQR